MSRLPQQLALMIALTAGAPGLLQATTVTVRVGNPDGVPIEDAVVMFDPLDSVSPPATATAVVDQVNRHFVPRMTVVQQGAAISFPNSDHIRHQVYSFSPAKIFTLKLYAGSPDVRVIFDKPGLVVLGCNIHDSMVGFIAVADSPYFAKSPASGAVSIDMPPGRYRMRIWHAELAAPYTINIIQVGPNAVAIPVQARLDHGAAIPAPWPE